MRIKEKDEQTFEYTPKACSERTDAEGKKISPTFSGTVTLKRIGLLRRLKLVPRVDDARKLDAHGIHAAALAIEDTMDLWVAVDLKHLKSNKEYKSVTALLNDPLCDEIAIEVGLGHVEGFATANGETEGN